jgi:hypothetical protein
LDGFSGLQAAVASNNAEHATVRNSKAGPGTAVFLGVAGGRSNAIRLFGNDLGVKGDARTRLAP